MKDELAGRSNLVITGLDAFNLREYGIYVDENSDFVTVSDCMVRDAGFHGVRLSGDNLTVTDCEMYGGGGRGLWVVHEEDEETSWVNVQRVSSENMIMFGPDFGQPGGSDPGDRRHDVFAHDLASLDHVRVEMGVIGGCFIDICSHLTVGRPSNEVLEEPNREMDRVNWDSILDLTPGLPPNEHVTVVGNPYIFNSAPVAYNWCFADIDREGASHRSVDVTDLLAVISAWGACPPAPSNTPGPPPHCAADVEPIICGDHVVNVSDLLAVISSWGACPANPQCGDEPPTSAGMPEAFPRTMSECWTACEEKFAVESQEWIACYEACIEAIERLEDEGP